MLNTNKNKILRLYYEKQLSRKDIMKRLNLSGRYITTVIKQDSRYIDEKKRRKLVSKSKASERYNKSLKQKKEADYFIYEQMKTAHNQASRELSINNTPISNIAFRKWNSSAYNYNKKKRCFVFNNKLGKSYAVPKIIK